MTCKNILTVQNSISEYNGCFQTYGFMLNRSRTATLALVSRLRLRSVNSFSFVQVMWTRSGPVSALSLMAACDAVFLSWMSWACGGRRKIRDFEGNNRTVMRRWEGTRKGDKNLDTTEWSNIEREKHRPIQRFYSTEQNTLHKFLFLCEHWRPQVTHNTCRGQYNISPRSD